MANRNTLHISKLNDFREWLIKDGWIIQPNKGMWEVLRASKPNRKPVIVYTRIDSVEHYTVQDAAIGVVRAFLKDCGE